MSKEKDKKPPKIKKEKDNTKQFDYWFGVLNEKYKKLMQNLADL